MSVQPDHPAAIPSPDPSPLEQTETNRNTPDPSLSETQLRAIDLLLQCCSDSDVARELSIGRTTLWRWKTHDPAFRNELAHRRCDAWAAASDRYQKLLDKASAVLDKFLDDVYNPNKLKAAQLLFYMAGRFKPEPPRPHPPRPDLPSTNPTENPDDQDLRALCNQVLKALQAFRP